MRHQRSHPAITDVASIYNMGSLHNGILTVVYAQAGVARYLQVNQNCFAVHGFPQEPA